MNHFYHKDALGEPGARPGIGGGLSLSVAEIFGPTVQGEGTSVGKPCWFLRLGGCNLTCSWCDTPFTWRWSDRMVHDLPEVYDPREELRHLSFTRIRTLAQAIDKSFLVVTGGEPLLQAQVLGTFLAYMREVAPHLIRRVEVETNGTQMPVGPLEMSSAQVDLITQFNVSPKLSNSGNTLKARYRPSALAWFLHSERAIFKFVVANNQDLAEVDAIVRDLEIPPERIYAMPLGTNTTDVQAHLANIAEEVIARNWNLTPRLHIDIWGKERGR